MKPKQAEQFNRMLRTLRQIGKGYQTPDQLRRSSEKEFGCEFSEALEYAYENIQQEARDAIRNVRPVDVPKSNP